MCKIYYYFIYLYIFIYISEILQKLFNKLLEFIMFGRVNLMYINLKISAVYL